jgi:hypothetical protein
MRASHARDWGSNPHSSTFTSIVRFSNLFQTATAKDILYGSDALVVEKELLQGWNFE